MEREPVYMESGKMQRAEISEEPDHFTLLPDPRPAAQNRDSFSIPAESFCARTAEWLGEGMSEVELSRRRCDIPKSRYLDFQLDLTRDFIWKHPLKAGGLQRSTVLTFQTLPPEMAFYGQNNNELCA